MPFSVLFDGVRLSRNRRTTYLLTYLLNLSSALSSWVVIYVRLSVCLSVCESVCELGRPQDFFFRGANSVIHFSLKKVNDLFLLLTLKTQVFTVTTNAQNTLQHFQGKVPPFPFLRVPMSASPFLAAPRDICYMNVCLSVCLSHSQVTLTVQE